MSDIETRSDRPLLDRVEEIEAPLVRRQSPGIRGMGPLWFAILLLSAWVVEGQLLHPLMLAQYALMTTGTVWIWLRRWSADRRIDSLIDGSSSPKRALRVGALVLAASSLAACGELREDLVALQAFQAGFVEEFPDVVAQLNVTNGTTFTVTFTNAEQADLPDGERQQFARQVAEYVRDHYSGYDDLTWVAVAFNRRTSMGPASISRTDAPIRFHTADLGPG